MNIIEFYIFEYQISTQSNNFEFLDQINWKSVFSIQKRKNHHQIVHIRIRLGSKFQLHQTILNFWNKRYFQLKTEKNEHDHWILYIGKSLSTKFQLKLTILIFGATFPKMGISSLKRKMNTVIEFYIFELV